MSKSKPAPPRPPLPELARRLTLPGAVVDIGRTDWFRVLRPGIKLPPGTRAPDLLRIPVRDAQAVLRAIIHLVADIDATAPPTVVWVLGKDELLVRLDSVRIACAPGLVTIALLVQCDELPGEQKVDIPFAVGAPDRPTGLVMSTFDRVVADPRIADTWSGSLTAFAWEALVTAAQQLAAAVGTDARKKPLVPGSIAADTNLLLIGAMARNTLRMADQ